ncbi:MAG: hypothetical protein CML66_13545 [Rhodobacteraceae bacterium]|nr:hypothetical protein [Paracoccaceae bacterium]MAY45979.1 hypothetical protein [Paracoccaceae bacterium]
MDVKISEARIAEIRTRFAMAGIAVPPDLETGVLTSADGFLGLRSHLHGLRPAADEPSNIFTLVTRAAK